MAVYCCSSTKRNDDAGQPLCTYEAEKPWRSWCPGCGRYTNILKIGAEKVPERTTFASFADAKPQPRILTGDAGADEVLGGGFVAGCSVVISGPPGCGKSTWAARLASNVARITGKPVLYASGEQGADAVGGIAQRIGAIDPNVVVLGEQGNVYEIVSQAEDLKPVLLVVDSISMAYCDDNERADIGSSEQIKAATMYLTSFCTNKKVALLIVAHVNKDGDLAGPKVMEHMVDTILELDPAEVLDEDGEVIEKTRDRVTLTSGKNRNGRRGVVTMYKMTGTGLEPVKKKSILHTV